MNDCRHCWYPGPCHRSPNCDEAPCSACGEWADKLEGREIDDEWFCGRCAALAAEQHEGAAYAR